MESGKYRGALSLQFAATASGALTLYLNPGFWLSGYIQSVLQKLLRAESVRTSFNPKCPVQRATQLLRLLILPS